ncbi:MAG TPA: hypothetical protein VJ697_15040 [Nitrososphaeraceae archaeon]|nr:hypothetical protein [Nitrososphaeraceae archaeon]
MLIFYLTKMMIFDAKYYRIIVSLLRLQVRIFISPCSFALSMHYQIFIERNSMFVKDKRQLIVIIYLPLQETFAGNGRLTIILRS